MDDIIKKIRKVCEHYEKGICTQSELVMEMIELVVEARDTLATDTCTCGDW